MTAGLHHAKGDAVVPMDVDLQDPPALILEFVKLWQTGDYDTVYGIRVDRSADTPMKRLTAGGFTASSTPSPPAPSCRRTPATSA